MVTQGIQSLLAGMCLVIIAACANLAGPDYKRPDVATKSEWSQDLATRVVASEAIRPDWWTGFGDPYLSELIQRSIAANLDLKILTTNIDTAGAAIGAAEAGILPRITGGTGPQFQKQLGQDLTQQYSQTSSLNWEIDIWGKLRKGIKARKAEFKATEADWRAGYLTLVSSVASKYFEIRQFDEQIDRQQRALETNEQIVRIYEDQYKEGLIPESQLLSQKAEAASLTRDLLDLKRQRQVSELNLATLLGIPAGEFHIPVAYLSGTVQAMEVPAGLPSDLLSRRPDIIAQEYRVLAAHELVGQARLARLPTFSLTSSAGSSSNLLSTFLKVWTFGAGPSISFPIFDPAIQATLKSSQASARAVEEQYRKTVIQAFEEVETTLVNLASRKNQKKLLEEQIKHLEIVRDVQLFRLKEGLVSQLEFFETERTLLGAQLAVLQTHQQILSDTLTLYKALGGGWPKETVSSTRD
jgi:efflux transporter, outer membrane factor (OMF) lipoprotein, NodT family